MKFELEPIKKIDSYQITNETVYDIEVENSHSFCVGHDNIVVHNSACKTRRNTGAGVYQMTAVMECARAASKFTNKTIIADGGLVYPGCVVKALASGADAVMLGNMLAGTKETPGKIIRDNGHLKKLYRGMSSRQAQETWKGYATSIEGESKTVPYRGELEPIFTDMIANILSGFSYQNARSISELQENAEFIARK